jgi:hypothetical protein
LWGKARAKSLLRLAHQDARAISDTNPFIWVELGASRDDLLDFSGCAANAGEVGFDIPFSSSP